MPTVAFGSLSVRLSVGVICVCAIIRCHPLALAVVNLVPIWCEVVQLQKDVPRSNDGKETTCPDDATQTTRI